MTNLCSNGCGRSVKPGQKCSPGHQWTSEARAKVVQTRLANDPLSYVKMGRRTALLHPEQYSKIGKIGGKIGGVNVHILHPNQAREMGQTTQRRHPNQSRENGLKTQRLYPNQSSKTLKRTIRNHPDFRTNAGKAGIAATIRNNPEHQSKAGKAAHEKRPEVFVKTGRKLGRKYGGSVSSDHQTPQARMNHSNAMKKQWANPAQAKILSTNSAIALGSERPTPLESRFVALFDYYNLPFDYTGDGEKWIGGKSDIPLLNHRHNPDFTHQSEKVVLEVANKHDKHRRYKISWQQWESERITFFAFYGYKCIVIWDDISDEEVVKILGVRKYF